MGLHLFVLPYVCFFSFSPDFSFKISPQLFKIKASNLVYRFTTTSCIVGLKMGLLLFVFPFVCFIFFLSRFFVKDISSTVYDKNFKFGIQVHNDILYRGIENGPSPFVLPYVFFLSLQIFRQRYLHNCLR